METQPGECLAGSPRVHVEVKVLGWLFRRLGETSEKETGVEYTTRRNPPSKTSRAGDSVVRGLQSFGNLEDTSVLRRHALRALCGALMDRRSDCQREHPFCGPGHRQNGDNPIQLIAQAVAQRDAAQRTDLIGVYLTPASGEVDGSGQQDILEFILSMSPTSPTPTRKLVVSPRGEGDSYPALYGPIVEATGGGYPSGRIDPGDHIPVDCVPQPEYCRWEYFDSELAGKRLVPTFHCLQVFGEWWVVEVDAARGQAQKVAALELAENPEH